MKIGKYFNKQEYTIYAVVAVLLFVAPVVSAWINPSNAYINRSIIIKDIMISWKEIAVLLSVLLIHDLFLAPLLVYKRKTWQYLAGMLLLVSVFVLYRCNYSHRELPPSNEMSEQVSKTETTTVVQGDQPIGSNVERRPLLPPPPPVDDHGIMMFALLLLGVGSNLGMKLYVKTTSDKRRMEELEKENMEQKLQQLKYQIHPHFFMNTLNNIHALVDIDPKKAQSSIIDLSKLMRYVLYENDAPFVQVNKEIEFMANYVSLMRIRYPDTLEFTVNEPDDGVGVWVPSLVFLSFVENAFKHGVSYKKKSFIDIAAKRYTTDKGETRMLWTCRNSNHKEKLRETGVDRASGVGLSNIRHRFDLLFGDNYTLNIIDGDKEFKVEMDIPVYTEDPNVYKTTIIKT